MDPLQSKVRDHGARLLRTIGRPYVTPVHSGLPLVHIRRTIDLLQIFYRYDGPLPAL